jgi:hypothetical protein
MNRYLLLVFLIFILVLAVLFFTNPDLLDKAWMWLVGFAGYILLGFRKISEAIKSWFTPSTPKNGSGGNDKKETIPTPPPHLDKNWEERIRELEEALKKRAGMAFRDHLVNVFRFRDDGKTTLGLLYVGGKFFCYTLEDTHQDEKIPGETRIPSGIYTLLLNKADSPLTIRYRNRFSWFDYHIELQDVPNYSNVYIHIGNTHEDTRGCLLIADGLSDNDQRRMILQSTHAFERFYKVLRPKLSQGQPRSIAVWDEDWVAYSHFTTDNRTETVTN